MSILDESLLVTKNVTSAFKIIELHNPCVPFQALERPVPATLAFPQIRKVRSFSAWHGNQDYGRTVKLCLESFTEFELKHWDDLVIGSFGQLQTMMQEGYKQSNIPRRQRRCRVYSCLGTSVVTTAEYLMWYRCSVKLT